MVNVTIYDKTPPVATLFVQGWYILDFQWESNRYDITLSKGPFGSAKGVVSQGNTIPFAGSNGTSRFLVPEMS